MSSQQQGSKPDGLETHSQEVRAEECLRLERERIFSRRQLLIWSLPAAATGLLMLPSRASAAMYHIDHQDAHGDYPHNDVHLDHGDGHVDKTVNGNNHTDGIEHYDVHADWHADHGDNGFNDHSDFHADTKPPHLDHTDNANPFGDFHFDAHGDIDHQDTNYIDTTNGIIHVDGNHQDITVNRNNHTDAGSHADVHADWHVDHNDAGYQIHVDHTDHSDIQHVDHTDIT